MMNVLQRCKRCTGSLFRGLWKHDDGAIAVWFALMLPVFVGATALALDMSYAMMKRQQLQTTASAAALAGARGLATDATTAFSMANTYAVANMPASGDVLNDVDITLGTVDMTSVPRGDFVAGGANPNAVQVTTRLADANNNPLRLFLAGIAGHGTTDVNTTATAVSLPVPPINACLIALNETSSQAGMKLSGGGSITGDGCGICINSTRPDSGGSEGGALHMNGTPEIDVGVGGAILVGGYYHEAGNVNMSPEPQDNQDTVQDGDPLCADPYADVEDYDLPGFPGCAAYGGLPGDFNGIPVNPTLEVGVEIHDPLDSTQMVTGDRLPAGIHCGNGAFNDPTNRFVGGSSVEFEDGIHYFVDTVFEIHGVSGGDEFFSTAPGGSTFVMMNSDIDISNATELYFTAPSVVDEWGVEKPGLLFFQHPDYPNPYPAFTISGGQDFFLTGTSYFGQEDIEISGGVQSQVGTEGGCLSILAGTFLFNGTPDIALATEGCGFVSDLPGLGAVYRLVNN